MEAGGEWFPIFRKHVWALLLGGISLEDIGRSKFLLQLFLLIFQSEFYSQKKIRTWYPVELICFKTCGQCHRCGRKQIFGGAKDFWPNVPKLAQKVVLQLLPTKFLPQISWRCFFGVTSKQISLLVFLQTSGAIFLKSNKVGRRFFPDFQGICLDV